MQEIKPGIFVEAGVDGRNLGVIRLDRGVLLVDLPLLPSAALEWVARVQAEIGPPRYAVMLDVRLERLITAAAVPTPVIASEVLTQKIIGYEEKMWREFLQGVLPLYPKEADLLVGLKLRRPRLSFNRRFRMYTPSGSLSFESVVGAVPGSLWVFQQESGLLFAGDSVSSSIPPTLELTPNFSAWQEKLTLLARNTAVKQIVPAEGRAPIARGELLAQLEFMDLLYQTAQSLEKKGSGTDGSSINHAARDLGQTFYNQAGNKGVRRIKTALELLVQSFAPPPASENTAGTEAA